MMITITRIRTALIAVSTAPPKITFFRRICIRMSKTISEKEQSERKQHCDSAKLCQPGSDRIRIGGIDAAVERPKGKMTNLCCPDHVRQLMLTRFGLRHLPRLW